MKIVVITVSNREGSNTVYAANVFKQLADGKGMQVVTLDLSKMKIEPYADTREQKSPSYPNDDFVKCVKEILAADAMVTFVPIYWFSDRSARLQNFIERFAEAETKSDLPFKEKMKGKPWASVYVSGLDPRKDTQKDAHKWGEAIYEIHRSTCHYLGARPVLGPWFEADAAKELESKKSKEVAAELKSFVENLESILQPKSSQFFGIGKTQ